LCKAIQEPEFRIQNTEVKIRRTAPLFTAAPPDCDVSDFPAEASGKDLSIDKGPDFSLGGRAKGNLMG